jgi:hypothetical protein
MVACDPTPRPLGAPALPLSIPCLELLLTQFEAEISTLHRLDPGHQELPEQRDARDCTVNMIARARLTAAGAL